MKDDNSIQDKPANKSFRRKYTLMTGIILLLVIASLVFIWLRQREPKPDPISEAIIRDSAAIQLFTGTKLWKDSNELIKEDFTKIKKFNLSIFIGIPKELSDIKLLSKFTNLQELDLSSIKYPQKNIPKWAKVLAKIGIFDLDERFAIDLNPIKNLSALKTMRLSSAQISDIKPLKNLTNLETLSIDNTHVSDLEPLKSLIHLQRLNIRGCKNIKNKQVKDLQKALPNLKIER